ncbi:MAG: ORF6N domain-containing protein [Candidatus Omnitrophica bacterium]|nr:ORF6N domain-containing protein [Candidatus Omnitrophota bacterium]
MVKTLKKENNERRKRKVEKVVPIEKIENRIFHLRGKKVMLDADLAELYGVPTKVLNQAVKRNLKRFPWDFMFRLTQKEKKEVVTICGHLQGGIDICRSKEKD